MSRIELPSLEAFVAALRKDGIDAVAMRVVDEIRPRLRGSAVEVGPQRWVELYAYRDGVVYAARVVDSPEDAARALTGIRVRRVSGNLG